ncbi:hypothetical protein FRC17_006060, partial [Serendipita sp. 399]
SSLDWTLVVECFQEPINTALTQLMTDSTEFSMLRSYLDQQREGVLPGSREAAWITAVYPTLFADTVNVEISSSENSSTTNDRLEVADINRSGVV